MCRGEPGRSERFLSLHLCPTLLDRPAKQGSNDTPDRAFDADLRTPEDCVLVGRFDTVTDLSGSSQADEACRERAPQSLNEQASALASVKRPGELVSGKTFR